MTPPLRISRPDGSDNRLSDILVTDGPIGVAVWITCYGGHSVNSKDKKVRQIYGEIEEWYHAKGTERDFPVEQMRILVGEYFEQN